MGSILSDLEGKVLMGYLDGKSYNEIAAEYHRSVKSIDNALQRVKRKLEKYLEHRSELAKKNELRKDDNCEKFLDVCRSGNCYFIDYGGCITIQ